MGRVSPVEKKAETVSDPKEGISIKSVRSVGTSSTVFATTERTTRELRIGRIRREFTEL